jgi:hypothetical protein
MRKRFRKEWGASMKALQSKLAKAIFCAGISPRVGVPFVFNGVRYVARYVPKARG